MQLTPEDNVQQFSRYRVEKVDIASTLDYEECFRVMRSASKNYSFASHFFPKEKRPHVAALYALLRVGDDRVDVSHQGFQSSTEAIEDWEFTYNQAFQRGYSSHPVIRSYLHTAIKFGIPQEVMAAYFRSMKNDLTVTRFPRFEDLLFYMTGSAIPVGRAMTYILGVRSPYTIQDALAGADNLSIAMQLSNFWRDIGEDWKIGRVYLPQEDLQSFGYSEDDLAAQRINPQFIELLKYEFSRTEVYYQRARESIKMLATGRWAVMSGLEIYRSILTVIQRNNYDVFHHRAEASKWQKLKLSAKALWSVVALK